MNVVVMDGKETINLPTEDITGVRVECYECDRWGISYVCGDRTYDSVQVVKSYERATALCDMVAVMYGLNILLGNED